MSSPKLTARQQQVFDLIEDCIERTGFPPTRAEISKHFGFRSANAAEEHLRALAKKGAIEMVSGTSRGIRLLTEKSPGLPIVGKVAAGEPVLAIENVEDYLDVGNQLFHPQADYLLRVEGDSMVNIGIMDGDLLAVHSSPSADNGQVVVARVDDEVTVKRLEKPKRGKQQLLLHAENDHYDPIKVDLSQQSFAIEGLAVGVIRSGAL